MCAGQRDGGNDYPNGGGGEEGENHLSQKS